jgi:hypothetical protein
MWSLISVAGYTLQHVFPGQWFISWGALLAIGCSASLAVVRPSDNFRLALDGRKWLWMMGVLLVFYAGGYAVASAHKRYADATFWLATAAGVAVCLAFTRAGGRAGADVGRQSWMIFAVVLALYAGILALVPPLHARSSGAAIPLLLSAVFALWGLACGGVRYVTVGLAIAALTFVGFFVFPEYAPWWNGAVVSGALLLAGLWMRRV